MQDQANMIMAVPYNLEAEQYLLGAILLDNEQIHKFSDFLKADHFYQPLHQKIYNSIVSLIDRGLLASPVTLKSMFEKEEGFSEFSASEYLAKLLSVAINVVDSNAYAKVIYDLAIRRRLIELGHNIARDAYKEDIDFTVKGRIEIAEQSLYNLAVDGEIDRGFSHLGGSVSNALERINAAFRRGEEITGLPSGFIDLDALLAGFHSSDLVILAGRPSMGKTAFAINIAYNICYMAAKKGNEIPGIGMFSLEMSSEQLATRMLSMMTGISSGQFRSGKIGKDDFPIIVEASKTLSSYPFYIDDTPSLSISALRTRARRMKSKHNIKFLLVDYLQLLHGSNAGKDGRVQEVSEITRGLKAIAKELDLPVIALSQLSRAVEQREDKRPQLSDLRESGSIEQDADVVMFIYREEYYLARLEPAEGTGKYQEWHDQMERAKNITEIIIAKQRNGPIGIAKMRFEGSTTTFSNLSENAYN